MRPDEKPATAAVAQIRALAADLLLRAPARPASPVGPKVRTEEAPLFAFDAGYDAAYLSVALAALPVAFLVRLRTNRCFFMRPAGQPPFAPGAVPAAAVRAGETAKFVWAEPATWPAPTTVLRRVDPDYGRVEVRAWAGLHAIVRRPLRRGPEGRGRYHDL